MLQVSAIAPTRVGEFTTHPAAFAPVAEYSFSLADFSPETWLGGNSQSWRHGR
jgi:hypothetical protein